MNGRFEKTDIAGPDVQTQIKRHREKLAADLQALIDDHTLWLDTTVETALKLLQREEKESEPDFLHCDHIVVRVPDWAKPTSALIESRRRLTERYRKAGEKMKKSRVAELLIEAGSHVQEAENSWDREEQLLGISYASEAIKMLKIAIQIMSGERRE